MVDLLVTVSGTGKTMMARAVAAQTKSTFLKLAGPQLVQMFIGDGAKLVKSDYSLFDCFPFLGSRCVCSG